MKAQYETQLVYRALDKDGDMVFGVGAAGQLRGLDAMAQVLKTRLAAIEGEWWEGDEGALPYFGGAMLGGSASEQGKNTLDLLIIARITDTVGVTGVSDVVSSIKNRQYQFSCKVQTVYGTTTAEVRI